MDHEGKKALLEKMRNYPFHAIFDRRGRKESLGNMHNAHVNHNVVPYGVQSKSMGVEIFTDDVTIDHLAKGMYFPLALHKSFIIYNFMISVFNFHIYILMAKDFLHVARLKRST